MTASAPALTPSTTTVEEYRELLDRVFDDQVTQWTAEAEETERFPRQLIEHPGDRKSVV